MNSRSRWQDWMNLAVGAYVLCLPLFTEDAPSGSSVWGAELFGAAAAVIALWALARPEQRAAESWQILIGLLLILAPLTFGYTQYTGAAINAYVTGAVVLVLAIWAAADVGKSADRRDYSSDIHS